MCAIAEPTPVIGGQRYRPPGDKLLAGLFGELGGTKVVAKVRVMYEAGESRHGLARVRAREGVA